MVESKKQLGKIGFDGETGTYWGEVLHLCAIETFHAETIDELRQQLRQSVSDRQEESDVVAASPADLFSESVMVNLDPTLLYELNQQAKLQNKSLNQVIVNILREVAERSQFPEPV